jgi:hypothetical protein
MQKLSGTSSGKNNKSCRIFHIESNKIGFPFLWFFCDFLRILQESAKWLYYLRFTFAAGPWKILDSYEYAPGSRKTPWKLWISCNVVLGGGGRRRWRNSGELVAGLGQGRQGGWLGTRWRTVCGLSWWRKAASVGGPRHQAAVVAGAGIPVRWLLGGTRERDGEQQ